LCALTDRWPCRHPDRFAFSSPLKGDGVPAGRASSENACLVALREKHDLESGRAKRPRECIPFAGSSAYHAVDTAGTRHVSHACGFFSSSATSLAS
jgi:hypothetical protein